MTGRVLVTGASGYAGGAAATALRQAGLEVLTAGRRAGDTVRMELMDPVAVAALRLPTGIDALVHAAAVHEIGCRADPVAAHVANVVASRAVLAAAQAAGIRRCVYVSTFHVFGRPAGMIDEGSAPTPANDYGLTHVMAEQMFLALARQGAIEARVLRPANLFGEPADWSTFDRWTLAPFDFARQAARQGRIQLNSDGSPVRNYVSAAELGRAVLEAVTLDGPVLAHVAGQPWSMRQLAELAAAAAAQAAGHAVPVSYGITPPETQWQFGSRVRPVEQDPGGRAMREFLAAAVRHESRAPA